MNLTFRHSGLQFFFITLTLEGRPPILSRLVEGEARPVLLPAGEVFWPICGRFTPSTRR